MRAARGLESRPGFDDALARRERENRYGSICLRFAPNCIALYVISTLAGAFLQNEADDRSHDDYETHKLDECMPVCCA